MNIFLTSLLLRWPNNKGKKLAAEELLFNPEIYDPKQRKSDSLFRLARAIRISGRLSEINFKCMIFHLFFK